MSGGEYRLRKYPGYALSDAGDVIDVASGNRVEVYYGRDGRSRVILMAPTGVPVIVQLEILLLDIFRDIAPPGLSGMIEGLRGRLKEAPTVGYLKATARKLSESRYSYDAIAGILGISRGYAIKLTAGRQ